MEAFLAAFSETTCRDELFPELTRAVAALNAAEDALEGAREKRRSHQDLDEFAAKENDAYREKARARRALFIIARLATPKGDGT